ncbi:MAG: tRNA uracil 4-sulfurtransferase ThiI, partial [Clostridia bacterium]
MKKVIILRYGEIYLKGKNRSYFENILIGQIKDACNKFNARFTNIYGRYIISDFLENDEKSLIAAFTKIFGLVSLSLAVEFETSEDNIEKYCKSLRLSEKTFRVSVVRADKTFPIISTKYEPIVGGYILDSNPNLIVKLKNPEVEVVVDIRENNKTYVSAKKIECAGGMPSGTAGNGLLLLSGGIDSPVAGYMMAKRGLKLFALHFHSFPYTSALAKDKVVSLAKKLEEYSGKIKIFVVKFTNVQEAIHKNCKEEYMITIMRRIMMRIAEKLCIHNKINCIITGESLGQVASQTIEGLTSTESVIEKTPVFRPLIGFDKQEIISVSEKIGTYETSILPYEDCCTVFLPKKPLIRPKIDL